MNCKEANEIQIADFLFAQGIQPKRIQGKSYWYLSPIRTERTPSFKVDVSINRWYDYGIGVGGKLVDLGIRLFEISVSDFLEKLEGQTFNESFFPQQPKESKQPEIRKVKKLENKSLLQYLEERAISSLNVAAKFCDEVYYSIDTKNYFAIGFKNDLGGYEVRNRYFKGTLGSKGITTILGEDKTRFILFEGYFDFLTAYSDDENLTKCSFIILNSVSQIKYAIAELQRYVPNDIVAYFDNDDAGKKCFSILRDSFPNANDHSDYYYAFKDINEEAMFWKKLLN